MPSTTKKDLYIAQSMGKLNEMSELPAKLKTNNAKLLVKTAEKMLKEAELAEKLQDEERAYVLFMKYFNVVSYIKKTADYRKEKTYFDDLLGIKNLLTAIDKAETLSSSLKERYDQVEAEAVAKKLASIDTASQKKVEDRKEGEKAEDQLEATQKEGKKDTNKGEKAPEGKPSSPGQLSCTQLYTLLQDQDCQIIMMDVRPIADYTESRINHKNIINVPAESIKPGMTVTYIEKALPLDSVSLWKQRGNIDHIILLDWKSTVRQVTVGTPLNTLKDALFKYDSTTIIRSEPLILEGGYEQWLLHYPMMCINPDFNKITTADNNTSQASLLDFDYPDFDETFKKPDPPEVKPAVSTSNSSHSFNGSVNGDISGKFPRIDRTTKPTVDRSTKKNVTTIEVTAPKKASTGPSLYPDVGTISTNQSRLFRDTDSKAGPRTTTTATRVESGESGAGSRGGSDSGAQLSQVSSDLSEELGELDVLKRQKRAELEDMEVEHARLRREARARLEQLRQEEQRLAALEDLRRKEQTDVADLMRKKKSLQQNLLEEQKKQEVDNQQKQREEQLKRVELDKIAEEEEKKRQRQEEVNRLRMERRKKDEEETRAVKEAEERARHEEEKQKKDVRAAEERARQLRLQEERDKLTHEEEEREKEKKSQDEEEDKARQARLEGDRKAKDETEKLRQERVRQEQEYLKQRETEKHAQLEKQRQLAEIERREKEKQEQLRLDRERQERERQDREKRQRDEEDRKRAEEAKRQADEKLRLINDARPAPKAVPSPNLSAGWEKRLDPSTRRYFYINHNEGKTQWEPPTVQGQQPGQQGTYTTKLQVEPATPRSRGLSRSSSSPNIAQLADDEPTTPTMPKMPTVNRAAKPLKQPEPTQQMVKMPVKRRDLNPVYGGVGRALTGLRNLGNTCYMNSTIQCLNNTSPLVTYLLTDMYLYDINIDYDYGTCAEVTDDFAYVVKALWSSQYRYITPRDFKSVVGRHQPMFSGYDQQDSQEFLTFLLDALHEGLNKVKKKAIIPDQDNDKLSDGRAASLAWEHHKLQNESIIVELFQGQLRSTVRCLTCRKRSTTFQAFMYLSLPIPSSSRCKLQDCLRQFSVDEKMTGSSRWNCTDCKCKRDAAKKIEIWKLPRILLIAFNRFVYEGQWRNKINTHVDFPTKDLDLNSFVQGPVTKTYQLYAVSNHFGSLDGGHYTACCKNPVTKKWYKFDDHEVYETSDSSIKTSSAYVLYYTSVDLPPPQFKQFR